MQPTSHPRIKICCISSPSEAQLAISHGASALVSDMPSGPGIISEQQIAGITTTIPPAVSSFLLTCLQDPDAIIDQQQRCRTNTIQICDSLPLNGYKKMRNELPGIKIVQVIHVNGPESIDEAVLVSQQVDAILLDSGNQLLPMKELGGTGRVHDWTISRQIREAVDVPIFLAGGINADNVGEAIRQVGPFGIDLCSSVRTNGMLDKVKLTRFFGSL
ncbi:MAG: phosphoribosylanthranilate isomerase [Chloroflexota bacterium]|nr:phosphoribosylanthranilate isomerase [Chloroflexota bacterium]